GAPGRQALACLTPPGTVNVEPGPSFFSTPPSGVTVNVPEMTTAVVAAVCVCSGWTWPAGIFASAVYAPLHASPVMLATCAPPALGTSIHFNSSGACITISFFAAQATPAPIPATATTTT